MKKFAFLLLYPAGNFNSGNTVLSECKAENKNAAVQIFQFQFPKIPIDLNGYAKIGDLSYCLAEFYS